MLDLASIVEQCVAHATPVPGAGGVATYIPALARADPSRLGMAVATLDGAVHAAGDADERFTIQSISKIFTLTLALEERDADLWKRVGREPSGSAFNSLVQLEYEHGIPRNPLINAGALVVTDVLISALGTRALDRVLRFTRDRAADSSIEVDEEVAASERSTGFRNVALATFLRSFGNLENDPGEVLDVYFRQCSISMTCRQLARAALYLANRGVDPVTGEAVVSVRRARRINALMLTCGHYDASGDFAFRVGLPGKSGVAGGIVAIVPGRMAIAVWSPALNEQGSSLAGVAALEAFTTRTELSVF